MDEFPSFYDHCKSFGQLRKECAILHPYLAKEPVNSLKHVPVVGVETKPLPLVAFMRINMLDDDHENVDKDSASYLVGDIIMDVVVEDVAFVPDNVHIPLAVCSPITDLINEQCDFREVVDGNLGANTCMVNSGVAMDNGTL
ncbi:hypothetical protein IEQ34_003334 [Dendrobium chrysotoxum]|uniref:Uncharacterized protein n=1 Tax=Dendrobium chrysotoxum TaxID=161865 RepID=A0AAV7HGU3_DENCH|nr:hypothetical protein IEQ34_003334 [Dendrobium chrysotoxum]